MGILTYLNPNAINDNSISSSKIDGTVASKSYVDDQVKTVDDKVTALEPRVTNAVQITYAELKSLRDAGKLVPGTQYHITDYTCTTIQPNTQSAGHQFDIIVTADDESTLNEVARAVKHEGDTYFANNDLNAWKIWYCLDNDTNRFIWADSTNGKGVIYRMIDEFNNDVHYDFKNIQFLRRWDEDTQMWSTTSDEGIPCYTFSTPGDNSTSEFADVSVVGFEGNYSSDNFIGGIPDVFQQLSGNCFFGYAVYNNLKASGECTLGSMTANNRLIFSHNIVIGMSSMNNSFDSFCESIILKGECEGNSFGKYCLNSYLGSTCRGNTLGNGCTQIILGDDCWFNAFGNDCDNIKFTSDSSASTKYEYYKNNHFGDGCQYILFKGADTASPTSFVQNYNFAQGLQGTSSAYLTIEGVRNRSFETKVAMNSNGELKIYCEADLIL